MRDYWYVYNTNAKFMSEPMRWEDDARKAAREMMKDAREVLVLHCKAVGTRVIGVDFGDPECSPVPKGKV